MQTISPSAKDFQYNKNSNAYKRTTGNIRCRGNRLFVNTADNLLELQEIQLAGKKRMASRDFLNGTRDANLYHAISK